MSALTWNIGDILHMSMSPDPRYWPQEMKKVRSGIPKHRDNKRNWTTNAATKRNISTCGGMMSQGWNAFCQWKNKNLIRDHQQNALGVTKSGRFPDFSSFEYNCFASSHLPHYLWSSAPVFMTTPWWMSAHLQNPGSGSRICWGWTCRAPPRGWRTGSSGHAARPE